MAVLQIFLQYCYSTILNIELYYSSYCKKKKKILLLLFPPKFLSHPSHFFVLFSLFLLCFSICSLLSEASSPKFLTHHTRSLSHLSSHGPFLIAPMLGFGFLRLEVGSAWINELGLDRWARIG